MLIEWSFDKIAIDSILDTQSHTLCRIPIIFVRSPVHPAVNIARCLFSRWHTLNMDGKGWHWHCRSLRHVTHVRITFATAWMFFSTSVARMGYRKFSNLCKIISGSSEHSIQPKKNILERKLSVFSYWATCLCIWAEMDFMYKCKIYVYNNFFL